MMTNTTTSTTATLVLLKPLIVLATTTLCPFLKPQIRHSANPKTIVSPKTGTQALVPLTIPENATSAPQGQANLSKLVESPANVTASPGVLAQPITRLPTAPAQQELSVPPVKMPPRNRERQSPQ